MNKKKVYIIGAVTGLEREAVVAKFAAAAMRLKEMGFVPVNPVDLVPAKTEWNPAMRQCIAKLVECDAVYRLPDWQISKGALLELAISRNLRMPEWCERTIENAV